jgi:antirestriction protein ArdC
MTNNLNKISAKEYLTTIRDNLVEQLQNNPSKWHNSFINKNMPTNAVTGKHYNSTNFFNLNWVANSNNYAQNLWASYLDWHKIGAKIIKGETHKAKVLYYGTFKKENEKTNKEDVIPFLKATPVFNIAQVDLSECKIKFDNSDNVNKVISIQEIDNFVNDTGVEIKHSNDGRCYYAKTTDYIHMTNKENFIKTSYGDETSNYYSVLFHELIHSTGHNQRLDRFKDNDKKFKDNAQQSYAFEELIAECGAIMLCQKFNLEKTIRVDHALYIKSWIQALKNDVKFLTSSLTRAYKATDYLLKKIKQVELKAVA